MTKAGGEKDRPPGEDELGSTADFGDSRTEPRDRIGPYKVLSTLGEGGFAVVYLAEQERPVRRRVALKVLKPGMDSKQVIARFEAERQALALLDHPNVAHVYDAGTTKHGQSYFVMENVRGLPLTEHCDRNKLTIEQRLELFLNVCEAIQHAHHKGIIHRDIKPSNIQVCIEGEKFVPKVIDFGVAKALIQPLTEKTLVTEHGQMIGTPEYMSPEQADVTRQDVDTRTDVYSLGVLLYRLLTGTLPFKSESLREGGADHIRKVICEESPKTPSLQLSSLGPDESTEIAGCRRTDVHALRRKLSGDLDWITLKAMEKDRTRRYQTAHALAEDIQRHLNNEPVLAGPPSRIYRLKKLLRRHRKQVIRAAVTAILLAGMAVIFVMYRQATHRAKEVESLRHKEILSKARELRAGRQFGEALAEAETILDSEHVGLRARLLHARLVLELQGPENAVKELTELVDKRDEIACPAHFLLAWIYRESDPGDPETLKEYQKLAKEHEQEGERLFAKAAKSSEVHFNRAMIAPTAERTLEGLNEALELDRNRYDALKSRALAHYALRDYWKMQRDALAMTVLMDEDPLGYSLLAIALREMGDFTRALEYHSQAIELSPEDRELYNQRYATYLRMGDCEHALEDAERCVELDPERFGCRFHLFTALVSLGDYGAARKQYDKIAGADPAKQRQFDDFAKRHVFEALGAGQSLELPEDAADGKAFSAMQQAIDYYRTLEGNAERLVAGVYGQSGWSPDGKRLAYGRSELYAWQPKILAAGAPGLLRSSGIEILDLESRKTRLLVSFGKDPAWSPDGKYIAFVREPYRVREYKEELWLMPAGGGEPRRLAQGGWPIWARDSKRIFFHSHSRTDKALYSISIDEPDAAPKRLIDCPSWFPGVSPDEKYIAYNEANELRIVEIASEKTITTWVAPEPVSVLLIRWKPDGKELSVAGPDNSDLGLWVFNVEQRKAWHIFEKPAISGNWSPDGSAMVVEIKNPFEENWLLRLDPDMPTCQSIASARTEEDYLRKRCRDYARMIDEDSAKADIYLRKLISVGKNQYRIGAYEDALEMLAAVEQHQPDTSPAGVALAAMTLHQLGRRQQSQTSLDRLRRLFDDGEHACSEKCLYEAEQCMAGSSETICRAWECIEAGQLKEASGLVEELRRSSAGADTESGRCIRSIVGALARAYYHRGKRAADSSYAETAACYEAALLVDPDFARARADLAWLQAAYPSAEFHDKPQALENATKACELTGWHDCRYISTLADVCARLGDFDGAVKWQQAALDLLPKSKNILARASYQDQLDSYRSNRPYQDANPRSFSTGRMVALWKLDEEHGRTAADASKNDNHGELVGDPKWRPSGGRVGGALACEGDGDWIRVGREACFDFRDEISVAAWVNIAKVPADWTPIVTKGNSAWRLVTYRAERKFHFAVAGPSFSSSGVFGTTEVTAGEWHHVAGTYDGATIRLYVDGRQEPNSKKYGDGLTANNYDVLLGGNSERPERSWHGLIDDVRIYDYALNDAEIEALYSGQGPGSAED